MTILYKTLLFTHIAAGMSALALFWVPMFTRKGGKSHRKIGKVYVWLMWYVLFSSGSMCLLNIGFEKYFSAGFLGFITVLTSLPLWYGIAILKHKKHIPDHILHLRKGLNALIFLFAIGMVVWSISLKVQNEGVLMLIFGIIGLTGYKPLLEPYDKVRSSSNWLFEHLSGMMGSGIAAHTAFLAFGGRSLLEGVLTGYLMIIPWVLPSILGTIAISRRKRKMGLA